VRLGIDPGTIARAERYERFFRFEFVASTLVLLGALAVYARHGARFARESAAGPIGTGMLLGMLGLAFVWLSQVPFRLLVVWWNRRYDQTESGYVETLFANWWELGAEFLFVSFALVVVMALARLLGRRWWLAAGPFFIALAALFSFVFPYLTPTDRLERPDLQRAGRALAAAQGVDPVPLRVEDVTDFTGAPNAYAVGLGPSKRIVFWNTMLEGEFDDDELRFVLAHEYAHHSRGHLVEGLAWYALFALPGAWLIALATRRRGGMGEPAAVPLALLVLVALDLASTPVYNLISRHMEREADWVAHETARDPEAAAETFRGFTIESLNDPDPPRWSYLLFDSHPTIRDRIALAEAWKRRAR
jgi:STE24 endopeptidase